MDSRDCHNDPHIKDRGFFVEVTHPEAGTHRYPGLFAKMSGTPLTYRTPSPCLGEHNEYVYKKLLGVSDEEYAELEREQHIGLEYLGPG
jgi:crotonobetainyl-CoA:carnitine CoA-transferase CaiB-like acyl-CoA transferase